MTTKEKLNKLLAHSEQEIIKDTALGELLRTVYKETFNREPYRFCATGKGICLQQLKNFVKMKKQDLKELIDNRTLIPSEKFRKAGLVSIRGGHVRAEFLHDEQAITLLEKGYLNESFFEKLPEGYGEKGHEQEEQEEGVQKPKAKAKAKPKTEK